VNILTFKDIDTLLARGDLKFYNFYNTDIDITNYFATQHYLENVKDDQELNQEIHIIFMDIEVYHEDRDIPFEFNKSDHPINAITIFDTKFKEYHSYFLLRPINKDIFNSDTNYYIDYLITEKYNEPDEKLTIHVYDDELQLIRECWDHIKQIDPLTISGFNSDFFDYPYIYRRLLKLTNKDETAKIFSKFAFVEFRNERLKIPDYPICDLLYLYKPRDEGGLSLGQKLSSYSLDAISEVELKRNKLDYKGQVTNLNSFYETNPTDFLLYNIIDVALCKLLNNKLKHIELQNMLRRLMKISFSNSLIGSSALFEGYTLFKLTQSNNKVRHGLVTQYNKTIDENSLKNIPKVITKKNDLKVTTIKSREYKSIISKFDGAYVKEPKAQIIHGTVIDMDAASLYPSKILESNIGFDTYKARILNPNIYKFLLAAEQYIGIQQIPQVIFANLLSLYKQQTNENKKKITNQAKFKQQIYFTMMFLFQYLIESNIPLKYIYEPKTDEQHYLLMFYLIPLLDIINMLHPGKESFNPFIYDYIFKNDDGLKAKYPIIYLLNNAGGCNPSITKLNMDETVQFLSNYSYTICGTCFIKHDEKIGLYSDMLKTLSILRKAYRAKSEEYAIDTKEYEFNNRGQLAVKRVANSSYGVYGLSSFRYSNHWLAQSITAQGRLTLKISQYITEEFLSREYENAR